MKHSTGVLCRGRAVAALLGLMFCTGCGKIPTWAELTGQAPPPPPPVVAPQPTQTTPTTTVQEKPVEPPKRNAAVEIANFKAMNNNQIDDAALNSLTSLTEGLEAIDKINANGGNVTNNGLGGLKNLPNLKQLELGNTKVDDAGMQALVQVTSLESLTLNATQIKDSAITVLTSLPNLKELKIENCNLSYAGWEAIGKMPKLEALWADGVTGLSDQSLDAACNAVTLKELKLNRCGGLFDKGLAALKKLEVLEALEVANSPITGEGLNFAGKVGLNHLKRIVLYGCPLTPKGVTAINKFKTLEYINIGETQIDDQHLAILLGGMKKLKHLHAARCPNIKGPGLAPLKNADEMEILFLGGTGITDKAFDHIKGIKNLKQLFVTETSVTGPACKKLKELLPECEIQSQAGRF